MGKEEERKGRGTRRISDELVCAEEKKIRKSWVGQSIHELGRYQR